MRKAVPQPPQYYWEDTDGCWWCTKQGRGCNGCKSLKAYTHYDRNKEKQQLIKEIEQELANMRT